MTRDWQPFQEPLRVTLTRTIGIAVIAGAILALSWGGLARWPATTAMMLWPSFGGHWLELWFLNWLRPRLPHRRSLQIAARLSLWFVGGVGFALGMRLTATALLRRPASWPAWWIGGVTFIGVEFVAQLALHLRGRPNFFDGLG